MFKNWLFEVRWMWHYRNWKPTRQKFKRFEIDFDAFKKEGVMPW